MHDEIGGDHEKLDDFFFFFLGSITIFVEQI